jgi:glycerate kinase
MHILIAPNAFKHALDASAAALAIAEGIHQAGADLVTTIFPIGDGGDGTGKLLTEHCNGEFVTAETIDPLRRKINAAFGLIDHRQTAVIEMAAASGLHLLKHEELAPLIATTYGTGLQIKQALDIGVKKIILCVGGSATVDGGTGILQALGIQFLDREGKQLTNLPATLSSLNSINDSKIDPRIRSTEIVILCDVKNILLGEQGAAAIFGPQKGASESDVMQLELGLTNFRHLIYHHTGVDLGRKEHGGAAGGVAAGLHALLGAKLVNGIDHFLDLTGFDTALANANMLITGEGRIDLQTLDGKAPFGVAARAKQKNIPVIALAGSIDSDNMQTIRSVFDELIDINPEPAEIAAAIAATRVNLVNAGKIIAARSIRS